MSGTDTFSVDEDGLLRDQGTEGNDPLTAGQVVRCAGRLDPALHKELVDAAVVALRSCVPPPRNPTPDAFNWHLTVTIDGAPRSCSVHRSSAAYERFVAARKKALASVCPGRP